MGAGAGQRGGVPQSMPQTGGMPMSQPMPPMRPMVPGVDDRGIAALVEALQQRQTTGQSMPFMQPGPTADQRMGAPMAPQPPAQGGFSGKVSSMPQNPMTQNRPFDPRLAMLLRQR